MNISNTIQLIGRLAAPPVYVTTENGADLTKFHLLTKRKPVGKADPSERVDRHCCVAWGAAALLLHEHLDRGSRIAIKGELCYGNYLDKQKGAVCAAEIHLEAFTFLD